MDSLVTIRFENAFFELLLNLDPTFPSPPLRRTIIDIQQLNLIMELLGKPSEEFMDKISSDSVIISFFRLHTHAYIFRLMYGLHRNGYVFSCSS